MSTPEMQAVSGDALPSSPSTISLAERAVTGIFRLRVRKAVYPMFSTWHQSVTDSLRHQPGFISRSLLTPRDDEIAHASDSTVLLCVHIVKFADIYSLERWVSSEERKEWIAIARNFKLVENPDALENAIDVDVQESAVGVLSALPSELEAEVHKSAKKKGPVGPQKWRLACVLLFTFYSNYAAHALIGTVAFFTDVFRSYPLAILVYISIVIPFGTFGYVALVSRLLKRFLLVPRKEHRWSLRAIVDDGFMMFTPAIPRSARLRHRIAKLEHRIERMKALTLGSNDALQKCREQLKSMAVRRKSVGLPHSKSCPPPIVANLSVTDTSNRVTVVSSHHVRWEFTEAFEEYIRTRVEAAMKQFPGFEGLDIVHSHQDGNDEYHSSSDDEEAQLESGGTTSSVDEEKIVLISRFDSYKHLEAWATSEQRREVMSQIEPMLVRSSTHSVQTVEDVHDAFSSMFVIQSLEPGSDRAPPIWKTMVLSVFSALFALWPIATYMGPWFTQWEMDRFLAAFIMILMFVPAMIYLTSPFLTMLFWHWLTMPRPSTDHMKQPWRTLDRGFRSWKPQLAVTLVYCGILAAIAAIVNTV
jgi:antibiotic biosynthesis monooxygenase (ABM) superfamily enzyme